MTLHDIGTLFAASGLLLLAHFARASRWALLLPPDRVRRFSLLLGLALGYVVNTLVPFRLGEVLRAYFVSERERIRFAFIGASVLAERVTDAAVVGAFSLAVALGQAGLSNWAGSTATAMLSTAILAVSCAFLVHASVRARRLAWIVASIFNDRVRFGILDLLWSFSEMIARGVVLRWRYLAATVLMWALYMASYRLFGHAIGESLAETLPFLIATPLRSLAEQGIREGGGPGEAAAARIYRPAAVGRHRLRLHPPTRHDGAPARGHAPVRRPAERAIPGASP